MTTTIQASGRISQPREVPTKTDSKMTAASMVLTFDDRTADGGKTDQWFRLVAFGTNAELLASLSKGTFIQISGELNANNWIDKSTHQKREGWQILIHSIYALNKNTYSEQYKKRQPKPSADVQQPFFNDPVNF